MKSSNIGGQAVLEGVMMKNGDQYAVAVRKPDGEIALQKEVYDGIVKWKKLTKIPFVRGMACSVVIAVAIFMVLPYLLSNLLKPFVPGRFARTVIEGIVRIVLFISYILLISKMKDIQRVFMYHGAEHKCINCIEHGMDLTVENVRKSSKQHKRCGTSFLFFVLFVSIIVCFFITTESPILRVLLRIALLPVIAGISYEIIRLAGNTEHPVVELLSKPGLALQNLTTKEPDDDMIEVAICSVEAVFDWKKYQKENFPEEP